MNIKAKPRISEIVVSPDNIDEHLDKCKSNRARTPKHVRTWIRAVKKGHFRDGGFIFADEKGSYDDGQHRLYALKATGHTASFYLISGMDRETLNMMIDGGKKRSNTDRLRAKGVKYAATICGAIEEILDIVDHWRKKTAMLLPDEVLSFYDTNNHELDQLAQVYYSSTDIQPKVLIAFQHLFTRINQVKADQFFAQLTHRSMVKEGTPLHAFFVLLASEFVVNTEQAAKRNRYIRNGLILAWNAHLKDETLAHIEPTERYITLDGTALISQPEEEGSEEEDFSGTEDEESAE